jgi:hypothetical protein
VQHLDALFDIEHGINGKAPTERIAVRQERSAPLMADLHIWLTEQVGTGSNRCKMHARSLRRGVSNTVKSDRTARLKISAECWLTWPANKAHRLRARRRTADPSGPRSGSSASFGPNMNALCRENHYAKRSISSLGLASSIKLLLSR